MWTICLILCLKRETYVKASKGLARPFFCLLTTIYFYVYKWNIFCCSFCCSFVWWHLFASVVCHFKCSFFLSLSMTHAIFHELCLLVFACAYFFFFYYIFTFNCYTAAVRILPRFFFLLILHYTVLAKAKLIKQEKTEREQRKILKLSYSSFAYVAREVCLPLSKRALETECESFIHMTEKKESKQENEAQWEKKESDDSTSALANFDKKLCLCFSVCFLVCALCILLL